MTTKEAFAPIAELQRNILIWGVVLILVVALLSMLVSRIFVRPIDALTEGISLLGSGRDDVHVDITSRDEFGLLARNFNGMVASIREKSEAVEAKRAENDALLRNILPEPIVPRWLVGERVADRLPQVTIAYLQFNGFDSDPGGNAASEADIVDALFIQLQELGEAFEVEKARTLGTTFVSACGLTRPRLDHSRQMVDYCQAVLKLLERFNLERAIALRVQISIAAGQLTSAVVGREHFSYEVWGEAADQAARIRFEAKPGQILVDEEVMAKVRTAYQVQDAGAVELDGQTVRFYALATQ